MCGGGGGNNRRLREDMGEGVSKMVTNLKAMLFGSLVLMPFTLLNQFVASLGIPFGGVKMDMA